MKKTLTPTASLIVGALTTEDPRHYDSTNALELISRIASEERLRTLAGAKPEDIDSALAWLRERIEACVLCASVTLKEEFDD